MRAAEALERKRKSDRKRLFFALIAAILIHLWLFYFTFPVMSGPDYVEKKKHKVSIKRWRPPPKEKPKLPPPKKKKVKKKAIIIPVPDPTPEEPEEIEPLEEEPMLEIPEDEDFVWGMPDEPDVPVGETEENKVYNLSEVSVLPQELKTRKPDYPEMARLGGAEARVIIQLIVDENGDVSEVSVLGTIGGGKFKHQFEKEAIKAAYKYKFKPAIQSGHPVPCWAKITVKFKLH
ncbi:energy transducer TonB [bacterium]|nr:energy transducer TonB [bacterium]